MTVREIRREIDWYINHTSRRHWHRFVRMPALRTRLWFDRNEIKLLWLAIIVLAIHGA